MKKIFGELNLTWAKILLFAIFIGIYTGLVAFIPATRDTSFRDISISFEWWILFGIIIIMNSKSPLDSALKCFIFFLVSQPLVYLTQIAFGGADWSIMGYYKPWFVWTLFTIPMGFIGYYLKKDKWWGIIILTPILVFLGYHYCQFLAQATTFFPNHLLSAIFCFATLIIYSLFIFKDKKLKIIQLVITIIIILVMTYIALFVDASHRAYNTTILTNGGSLNAVFDDTYKVSLADESFGSVYIVYEENIEDYMVNASFTKTGETKLIVESPEGDKKVYNLVVHQTSYKITESED